MTATVWIVDDSATELAVASRALHPLFAVVAFRDGASMLERLASAPAPDVLVLDWEMPGLDGLEVCRFLRANAATTEMPILILTAHGATEDLVAALDVGANDYVAKPFAAPELVARVSALARATELRARAKQAEAALRDVFSHLPEALLAVDGVRRITYANREAEQKLGERLVGRALADVLPQLDVAGLAPAAEPYFLRDLDVGGRLYAPLVRSLPFGDNGATVISFRDVTNVRRRQQRRVDFYSMIAHDLRSPVQALMMRADLLMRGARGPLSPSVSGEIAKMRDQMSRMVGLINDFLDLARAEGGGMQIERVPVDAATVVRDVLDELGPALADRRLDVAVVVPDAPAAVLGDRRRLTQVLSNLVGNAMKFTPPDGHIEVRVERRASDVQFCVRDTGRGIPLEVQPTLFHRFERGDAPPAIPGTGLGLLIVREIVEAHGGSCGVESAPGRGSEFWFRIPLAADAHAGASA